MYDAHKAEAIDKWIEICTDRQADTLIAVKPLQLHW